MADFDDFAHSGAEGRAVQRVLVDRGGFHLYGPNDATMEEEVRAQADVVMAVLREYHKWLKETR